MENASMATALADEGRASAVSWGSISAGGFASAALMLLLLALGSGIGMSSVSPWPGQGISATTFTIGAGIYLAAVSVIASAVGGYLAGRLRVRWLGADQDEVYFRDTAHGLLSWAVQAVIGAAFLASAGALIAAGGTAGLTGGAAAGVSQSASSGAMDGYVDRLLRVDPESARAGDDLSASRAEMLRLLPAAVRKGGDLTPADRAYVSRVVAARTGLSQAEADRRVSEIITEARAAADAARSAAAKFSLWLAAAMLLGALSASLAATEGGGLRDGTWNYRTGRVVVRTAV
jgi:hypothetical protein